MVPAIPRDRNVRGVFCRQRKRDKSIRPACSRCITLRNASGVMSRGARPVPPVLKIKSIFLAGSDQCVKNAASVFTSSGKHSLCVISDCRCFTDNAASVGPEVSVVSPREHRSLMVKITTRVGVLMRQL